MSILGGIGSAVGGAVNTGTNIVGGAANTTANTIGSGANYVATTTSNLINGGSSSTTTSTTTSTAPTHTTSPGGSTGTNQAAQTVQHSVSKAANAGGHTFLQAMVSTLHTVGNVFNGIGNAVNGVASTVNGVAGFFGSIVGGGSNLGPNQLAAILGFVTNIIAGVFYDIGGILYFTAGGFQYLMGKNGYQITAVVIGAFLLAVSGLMMFQEDISVLDTLGLEALTSPGAVASVYENSFVIALVGLSLEWWASSPKQGSVILLATGIISLVLALREQSNLFLVGSASTMGGFVLLFAYFKFNFTYLTILSVGGYGVIIGAYLFLERYVKPRVTHNTTKKGNKGALG